VVYWKSGGYMRNFFVKPEETGRKIGRIIKDRYPEMPVSALYKAFRKKDVKVNSIRIKEDFQVSNNDFIEIYIKDEILFSKPVIPDSISLTMVKEMKTPFSIIYQDENIIIVNKIQGIPVQPYAGQATGTLIDLVRNYLADNPSMAFSTHRFKYPEDTFFTAELCHRLDRNTGGLVMIAKNSRALKIILDKIKKHEI
jgi:23S rRNA pseudouridine955/2504/2580 synthase